MIGRNLAYRIEKLELVRAVNERPQWLFHVSDPPTSEELAAIAASNVPHVVMPWPCKTVDEWVAKYGSGIA